MSDIAINGDKNSVSRFQASARLFNLIAPHIRAEIPKIKNLEFTVHSRAADATAFLYDSCVTETQNFCTDYCVLILGEPPEIVPYYPQAWISQFDKVVGPRPEMILHDNFSLETLLPWGFESEHLDSSAETLRLAALSLRKFEAYVGDRSNTAVMFCSNKLITRGHRFRRLVAEKVSASPNVELIGSHIGNFQENKLEVLRSHRFEIVIENSCLPSYATEKLWDSIVAGCIPIYHGGPLPPIIEASIIRLSPEMLSLLSAVEHFNSLEHLVPSIESRYEVFKLVIGELNPANRLYRVCQKTSSSHLQASKFGTELRAVRPLGDFRGSKISKIRRKLADWVSPSPWI